MPLARALAVLLLLPAFQLRPPAQGRSAATGGIADAYGEPRDVDLSSIVFIDTHRRDHVRTKGRLDLLGSNALALSDGGNQVLVLIGPGLSDGDVRSLLGSRVSARGIVRPLHKKEYIQGVDSDLIDDPTLPPLPSPDASLPRVSLTLLSISDDEPLGRPGRRTAVTGWIGQILASPASVLAKPVTVEGQFRGRNLFDDLPKVSQQSPGDWVLKDGDHAAWVVGKPPQGKGFSLDLDSKSESTRRLEVTGKATVVDGIVYIKATRVAIATRNPKPPER